MGKHTFLNERINGFCIITLAIINGAMSTEILEKESPVTINNYGTCSIPDTDSRLKRLEDKVTELMQKLDRSHLPIIRDCSEVVNAENQSIGVYQLRPENSAAFDAPCMLSDDGLWTIIQQRTDGKVDFQRCWQEYRRGFGNFNSSFYLGNDKIYAITQQRQYKLRVDIWDWGGMYSYAEYKYFQIDNEEKKYALHYTNFSGSAGDALNEYHQNKPFSTLDQDNDYKASEHCARLHGGGWWYNECDTANLNGYYSNEPELRGTVDKGVEWDTWMNKYSFKKVRMRIKPAFPN